MTLRKSSDLIFITVLTIVTVLIVASGFQSVIRVLLVLPLALIFPGYAVIAAMFPARTFFPIETHLALSVAVSVACIILGGLFLNFTPWGLRTESWLVLLTVVIFSGVILGLIRRYQRPSESSNLNLNLNLNWQQVTLLGIAVVLAFAAIRIARNGIIAQPQPGFTQLWMLPTTSEMPDSVQLGIRNEEANPHTYRLVVTNGDVVVGQWDAINLMPDQQWDGNFHIDIAGQPASGRLEARLYRDDVPDTIYRNVSLVLTPPAPTSP